MEVRIAHLTAISLSLNFLVTIRVSANYFPEGVGVDRGPEDGSGVALLCAHDASARIPSTGFRTWASLGPRERAG